MKTVQKYWEERLEAGIPLYHKPFLETECITRYTGVIGDNWPSHISRNGFYYDFRIWCRAKGIPLKQKYNSRMFQIRFNNVFLVYQREQHLLSMKIKKPSYFEGSWFTEEHYQKFLRLASLEEHRAVMERLYKVSHATPAVNRLVA